jgi:hypothetical protein
MNNNTCGVLPLWLIPHEKSNGSFVMKISGMIILVGVVLFLTSCGADPGKKNTEFNLNIQGIWESDCIERVADFGSKSMEGHGYAIRNWNFSSNEQFVYTEIHYSESQCESGNEVVALSGSGTYELGDDIEGSEGKHIKFVYSKFSTIIKDSDLAAELTEAQYCGEAIWRVDEPVSLFGKSCSDAEKKQAVFPSKESTYSDVMDLKNDKMWMGKKDTPISSQNTEEIDSTLIYKKA